MVLSHFVKGWERLQNYYHAWQYYYLGLEKNTQEDCQAALHDYDQAIALNPFFPEAFFCRGNFYFEEDNYLEALKDYHRAIALRPDYAEAYYNRGNTYFYLDQYQEALADYDRAIALRPQHMPTWANRAKVKDLLGDLQGAIEDVKGAIVLLQQQRKIDCLDDLRSVVSKPVWDGAMTLLFPLDATGRWKGRKDRWPLG